MLRSYGLTAAVITLRMHLPLHEVEPEAFLVGGEQRKKFVRISIEHIARTMTDTVVSCTIGEYKARGTQPCRIEPAKEVL